MASASLCPSQASTHTMHYACQIIQVSESKRGTLPGIRQLTPWVSATAPCPTLQLQLHPSPQHQQHCWQLPQHAHLGLGASAAAVDTTHGKHPNTGGHRCMTATRGTGKQASTQRATECSVTQQGSAAAPHPTLLCSRSPAGTKDPADCCHWLLAAACYITSLSTSPRCPFPLLLWLLQHT